ncbi:hypothetical protein MY3296_002495 [Beauveria thailandica]
MLYTHITPSEGLHFHHKSPKDIKGVTFLVYRL